MKLVPTKLKRYLKEPYPYYYSSQQSLLLFLGLISILSFSFSYFFEPFQVNVTEHKINSIWILVIHAFIPFPIVYIYFSVINSTKNANTHWTLGKELFNLSVILLIIGVINFLIRDVIYTNPDNWSFRYFGEEIRNTFLVGTLLLFILLPLNLERLINKHTAHIKKISLNTIQENSTATVIIKNEVSNEDFELDIKDFIFAKVESNYTEVFTFSSDKINKRLIRITLKDLEGQLQLLSCVFRTHRSYLVNLDAITSISGNAQGYQLVIKNCSVTIPVSRSNIKRFNAAYSKL